MVVVAGVTGGSTRAPTTGATFGAKAGGGGVEGANNAAKFSAERIGSVFDGGGVSTVGGAPLSDASSAAVKVGGRFAGRANVGGRFAFGGFDVAESVGGTRRGITTTRLHSGQRSLRPANSSFADMLLPQSHVNGIDIDSLANRASPAPVPGTSVFVSSKIVDFSALGKDDLELALSAPLRFALEGTRMRHVISALVQNQPGVLAHVSGMLASRGFNIDSLAVGATEDGNLSRMTFVVHGDQNVLEQARKQLGKIITVVRVDDISSQNYVERDLMLIKVNAQAAQRIEISLLVETFRGKVIDITADTLMIEISGSEDKIEAFISLMRGYGIIELARTGRIALVRGRKEGVSA